MLVQHGAHVVELLPVEGQPGPAGHGAPHALGHVGAPAAEALGDVERRGGEGEAERVTVDGVVEEQLPTDVGDRAPRAARQQVEIGVEGPHAGEERLMAVEGLVHPVVRPPPVGDPGRQVVAHQPQPEHRREVGKHGAEHELGVITREAPGDLGVGEEVHRKTTDGGTEAPIDAKLWVERIR